MAEFQQITRETLGATVYQRIRQAILHGEFQPNEPVKIKKTADQMGVSPTPVRDALLQLVMERVLEMPNSREIRVPLISHKNFVEIRTLRIMMEGYAAERAAVRASLTDVDTLTELNANIQKAFDAKDPKQALMYNRDFHAYLYGISDLPIMQDVLDRLWLRMSPLIADWSVTADTVDFTQHHFEVIEALRQRDGAAAKQAIIRDIEAGGDKIEARHEQGAWTA